MFDINLVNTPSFEGDWYPLRHTMASYIGCENNRDKYIDYVKENFNDVYLKACVEGTISRAHFREYHGIKVTSEQELNEPVFISLDSILANIPDSEFQRLVTVYMPQIAQYKPDRNSFSSRWVELLNKG